MKPARYTHRQTIQKLEGSGGIVLGIPGYSCVYSVRLRRSRFRGSSFQKAQSSPHPLFFSFFFTLSLALFAIFLGGCGSGMSAPPPPPPGPASVTVLLSSTANDQLTEFFFTISSITLSNKAGAVVTLFNNPTPPGPGQPNEFIHLNGSLEPLVTVSVPAGVYDSAALTFVTPVFSHITTDATSHVTIHFDEDSLGTESATVNLPSPITVNGAAMSLVLNLQVSSSVSFSTAANGDTFTITPTFNLAPLSPSTSVKGNEIAGLQGQVSAISTANNSFTVRTPNFETLTFQTSASTVFQGIGSFSALSTGMDLILDAGIQSSGSLQATRVAVRDVTALNVETGPIVVQGLDPSGSGLTFVDVLNTQHLTNDVNNLPDSTERYDLESNTTFRTAEQFTNIAALPFPANFGATDLFLGQNIYVSSTGISSHTPATTITLMPQTINGTISSISSSGNFQVYTVSLASYDLLTQLDKATTVTVYVDSSTHMLNSTSIASGGVFRFNGLLFNDNGAFRMDCVQVNDGVTE